MLSCLTLAAALDIIPDRFSVGAGIIYSRADVTLSKSVDFGALLFSNPATRPLPFARPQAADGFAEIQGDDNGFGWTVGVNVKPIDQLAIGVSYRSEIDYELSGTADWTVPGNVAAVFADIKTGSTKFNVGFLLGLKAFSAAVLGGIGNLRGAALGGLLLGLVENYGSALFGSNWRDFIAFLVLIALLMFRPTGLLGESLGRARA